MLSSFFPTTFIEREQTAVYIFLLVFHSSAAGVWINLSKTGPAQYTRDFGYNSYSVRRNPIYTLGNTAISRIALVLRHFVCDWSQNRRHFLLTRIL